MYFRGNFLDFKFIIFLERSFVLLESASVLFASGLNMIMSSFSLVMSISELSLINKNYNYENKEVLAISVSPKQSKIIRHISAMLKKVPNSSLN